MRLRKNNRTDSRSIAIAKTADALAHPLRVDLFRYILRCNKERLIVRNKDLVKVFGYSQATISQHLNMLKDGGLLTIKNQATSSCYYVNIGVLTKIINELSKMGE